MLRKSIDQKYKPWGRGFFDFLGEKKPAEGSYVLVSVARSVIKIKILLVQSDARTRYTW